MMTLPESEDGARREYDSTTADARLKVVVCSKGNRPASIIGEARQSDTASMAAPHISACADLRVGGVGAGHIVAVLEDHRLRLGLEDL